MAKILYSSVIISSPASPAAEFSTKTVSHRLTQPAEKLPVGGCCLDLLKSDDYSFPAVGKVQRRQSTIIYSAAQWPPVPSEMVFPSIMDAKILHYHHHYSPHRCVPENLSTIPLYHIHKTGDFRGKLIPSHTPFSRIPQLPRRGNPQILLLNKKNPRKTPLNSTTENAPAAVKGPWVPPQKAVLASHSHCWQVLLFNCL